MSINREIKEMFEIIMLTRETIATPRMLLPFMVINNSMWVSLHLPCILNKGGDGETGDE